MPDLPAKRTVVPRRRRYAVSAALGTVAAAVLGLALWSMAGVTAAYRGVTPAAAAAAAPAPRPLVIYHAPFVRYERARAVPVLVYHEMNNGCAPSAPVCKAADPETVSTAQFRAEMAYMFSRGYHTVTMAQYQAWLGNRKTRLPSRPFLITADNGIWSFLSGAQPALAGYGYTAVAAVVTGFADGAGGHCAPRIGGVSVQPGCPRDNAGWDATWAQLRSLDPRVWEFILEAGPSGHYVQDYDPHCRMFDACLLPGETVAQYQVRLAAELGGGETALAARLGSRVNPGGWVVPYSDLGYPRCAQGDCTPQDATIPQGYLVNYADAHFRAVFVEDASRNAIGHERFRFDVNGPDTEASFQSQLAAFTAAGAFDRSR